MPLPHSLLLLILSITSALQHPQQSLSLLTQPLTSNTNNSTLPWHPLSLPRSSFNALRTLQKDRLLIASHPLFENPVLIKLDALIEVPAYQLLHGTRATPEFYSFVTNGQQDEVVGFVTEFIDEHEGEGGKEGCVASLKKIHERGIAHGDAHDGNCLMREDGSGVWVDFELFVEGSKEEVERDLDILGRCLDVPWEGV